MRIGKIIISFLCAVILCFSLFSCSKEDTNSFEELYEAISVYEDMISKQESEKEEAQKQRFVIVIPEGCGAELFDSAAFLSGVMSKYVGYGVEVYYDSDLKQKSTNFEILIGDTNREKSQKYIKELRSLDFGYKYLDGAFLIGAHNGTLISNAVRAFAEAIQSGKIDPAYINAAKPYSECGEYSVSEARLNGFLLCEYAIVYPDKNTNDELAIANRLKCLFEERLGYTLRVVSDKSLSDSTRCICIGKTSRTTSGSDSLAATVSLSDKGDIELLAKDNFGLWLAAEKFFCAFGESEADGACEVSISGVKKYEYTNDDVSFFVIRDDFGSGEAEAYINAVSGIRSADVSVLDNLSSSVIRNIRNNGCDIENVSDISFYYLSKRDFKCVESRATEIGDGEIFTLVVERGSGDRFAFIAGFCKKDAKMKSDSDFCDSLIEECKKYSDIPVLVVHEMTDEMGERFLNAMPRFETVGGAKGIYFSSDRFELVRHTTSAISMIVEADTVRLKICYK